MASRIRHGMTAVELLVVIAIIGILLALVMSAVMMVRGVDQASTTNIEIREMSTALENFKTKYGIYPPSKVTLSSSAATADPILQQIWPSLNHSVAFDPTKGGLKLLFDPMPLTGDQCLVFFLGGLQNATGCMGFSTSKVNPFDSGTDRDPPLFKFKMQRLFVRPGSQFFSYADGFSKPEAPMCYAYFAPLKSTGYNDAHCNTALDGKLVFPMPYKDASNAYLNKLSFQIISAGKNGFWGAARQWGSNVTMTDPDSLDNLTNFANGILSGS